MRITGLLATAALLLGACSPDSESKEAVRQGIIEHLSGRAALDVKSMDIEVTSVAFRGDEAEATVSFKAKGSTDPAASMQMQYTLERKGGRWVVKGRAGGGDAAHGGTAASPHEGQAPSPGGGMPPGHPPTGPKPGAGQQ